MFTKNNGGEESVARTEQKCEDEKGNGRLFGAAGTSGELEE